MYASTLYKMQQYWGWVKNGAKYLTAAVTGYEVGNFLVDDDDNGSDKNFSQDVVRKSDLDVVMLQNQQTNFSLDDLRVILIINGGICLGIVLILFVSWLITKCKKCAVKTVKKSIEAW